MEPLPFALVENTTGGYRLTALGRAAAKAGLEPGQLLTDARALLPELKVEPADKPADRADLLRLAGWATRFTPWVGLSGADGLLLDITGVAHLFGGEEALGADLLGRLGALGIEGRAAIAGTPGAAWALARFADAQGGPPVLTSGAEAEGLAPMPVAALRLSEDILSGLERLGLQRVGDVLRQPRAGLARRFPASLLERLDQALGRVGEPVDPVHPPAAYRARLRVPEPLSQESDLIEATRRLGTALAKDLAAEGRGALRLRLMAFRTDGEHRALTVGAALPLQEAGAMARLFAAHLGRLAESREAGFGYETLTLEAVETAPRPARQTGLAGAEGEGPGSPEDLARLADTLGNRLGLGALLRLDRQESYIPERAVLARSVFEAGLPGLDAAGPGWAEQVEGEPPRPLFLLPCAEPAEVTAEVPEGPPRIFRWRKLAFRVARAEGPERIAPEWWRPEGEAHTRDYYRVEDEEGRRFWLYRDGLYGRETQNPRWYVHGVFA